MVWLFHPIARILSRIEKNFPQDGTKTIQLLSMEENCQLVDVFKAEKKLMIFWGGSSSPSMVVSPIHQPVLRWIIFTTKRFTVAQALKTTPSRFWYATCAENLPWEPQFLGPSQTHGTKNTKNMCSSRMWTMINTC